ncbi:hypothetical protein J3R82DRAFT_11907 [Butyriboletus roseoflavus]|nr:hypothetical protein J3R82DRAFT_11907 [Butyriboletus roseoflavus]
MDVGTLSRKGMARQGRRPNFDPLSHCSCFIPLLQSTTLDLVLDGASPPSSLDRNFILLRWISPAASWSLIPNRRGSKVSPSSSVINQANSIPTRPPVLSSKQFARRWRECNERIDSPPLDDDEEEAWRTRSLDSLV